MLTSQIKQKKGLLQEYFWGVLKKHHTLDRKPTTDQSSYTSNLDLSYIKATQRSVGYELLRGTKITQTPALPKAQVGVGDTRARNMELTTQFSGR